MELWAVEYILPSGRHDWRVFDSLAEAYDFADDMGLAGALANNPNCNNDVIWDLFARDPVKAKP